MKPWRQGLDGLCGVYSVLNSIHLALKLDAEEAENVLFPALVEPWKGDLYSYISEGTHAPQLEMVLEKAATFVPEHYKQTFAYKKLKEVSDVDQWLDIQQMHLERSYQFEDGRQTRSVIVGFSYPYGHWTLVRDITKDHLITFDSYKINKINHHRIFFSGQRGYVFDPLDTYFITIGE
jgi:hypothetical protein